MMKNLEVVFRELDIASLIRVIGIGIVVLVVGALLIQAGKFSILYFQDLHLRKNSVLLKVLPKNNADIREVENLIKNIHSMLLNTKWRKFRYGRPYMSFEVGAKKGKINFYMSVPKDMKDRIIDRMYQTYSEVAIEEVEEYIPECKNLACYSAELKLAFYHMLKLKTKQNILGSVLASMKDLDKNDFVGLQIIVRPIDNKWQIKGRKSLEKFEREGIRPGEKGSFSDNIDSAKTSFLGQIEDELKEQGIKLNITGSGGGALRKTKLDRKEIVVASEKLAEVGFETIIRVVAAGKYKKGNTARVKSMVAAFSEVAAENRLKRDFIASHRYVLDLYKKRKAIVGENNNILTPSELANIFLELPGQELTEKYKEVEKLMIKEFDIPTGAEDTGKGIVFAKNIYRASIRKIEFKDKDIVRHVVTQGKTGTGKSEFMKTAFLDHISNKYDEFGNLVRAGKGTMVLEPHGKLADELLKIIPEYRRKDTIVFDLFSDYPWPLNFCKVHARDSEDFTAEQLKQKTIDEAIEIFKRQFSDVWTEKNEYFIENGIRTIIDAELSMVELPRLFGDKKFRKSIIPLIKDVKVKNWWKEKFKENAKGELDSSVASTAQSVEYKLDKFIRSQELQRVLGQNDCIDFKDILDNNKIIIFKFSKDKMAKDRISFLGGIAMKLLIVAGFARDKSVWNDPFVVFIDEAQNFISESIKDVLYELRKYGIGLFLMHQELEQMKEVPGLINAIYNNVGTSITFTTGDLDAPFFAKKYGPKVDEDDLQALPSRYGYCKLMVNGTTSDTFNIYSIDRPEVTEEEGIKSVKEIMNYNKVGKMSVEEIDRMIAERYEDTAVEEEKVNVTGFAVELEEEKLEEENDNKGYWG